MRAMRKPIFERDSIRVNCVCPGMTESPMTRGIVEKFQSAGLYWQSSNAVAQFVLGLMVEPKVNGKAVYIEGGEGWEFEDSFYETQPQWLGEEPTRRMRLNAEAVNKV
jgi:NAD(P)-dependent dehydrogenase (short-subunit alcohol dehydrogenase family)